MAVTVESAEVIGKVKDLEAELQYYKDKYRSLSPADGAYQGTLLKIKYLEDRISRYRRN